ncbi:MAG: leucine-rich repeat domain-containing protein, partial [Muribaculum sp.]|nr:leucine-rich repeat domain-containing protein [Muribaculum sp.]
ILKKLYTFLAINNQTIHYVIMSKSKFVFLLFNIATLAILLNGCSKADPKSDENAIEITVNGDLQSLVNYDNIRSIESLTINGIITNQDWNVIYEMALTGQLKFIDMYNASIIGSNNDKSYDANEIPPSQFNNCRTLQKIILPKNLKHIGAKAFSGCIRLSEIVFPNSLKSIGEEAFSNCSDLISIDFPSSLDSIGARAFYNSAISGEFKTPTTLKVIGKQAFSKTDISCVIISHDVRATSENKMYTLNNNSVFASCDKLTEIVVNEGCTSLELGFTACNALEHVVLPSTLINIGYNSKHTHNHIFSKCQSLSGIRLPEGLQHIGQYSFESTIIETLDIPKSIKIIENYSFKNSVISKMIVHWDTPLDIEASVFSAANLKNSVLCVPKGTKSLYSHHQYWGLFGQIS